MTKQIPIQEPGDILVVEDSSLYISAFRKVLDGGNYKYSLVTDGAAGWATLQRHRPRVLLLDWELPGMDGLTVCRNLRAQTAGSYVYVILLTTHSRLEDVMRGFEAGADDYMTKPFEPAVLQAKIRVGFRVWDLEKNVARQVEQLAIANREQQALIERLQEKNTIITDRTEALHRAQQQLLSTAHRAGMAEVATCVLHSVGNLLNSSVTSSTVIGEVLNSSRWTSLKRLVDLLPRQPAAFAAFVNQDPRGLKLPEFLDQLTGALGREHETIKARLMILAESLEQIRQITALQQTYAGVSGVKEQIAPAHLVEDAARLFLESFRRHDISMEYDLAPGVPEIAVEKHKALQILMNLLQNARDATKNVSREARATRIRLFLPQAGKVAIAVTDNGVGIKPENLTRIFNFGFTTKPTGHGFGLHTCANLASQMGGTLTASSDGEGCGATFTLSLPVS